MASSRVPTRSIFSSLLCTAVIAGTPAAWAQAPGGGQGFVPGLVQQPTVQQQPVRQQPGNPGYYQGHVQQGQFPNQAPGVFPGVPAGTLFTAKLETSLDSGDAQVGDKVTAKLGEPLLANGTPVIPAGSMLTGSVMKVTSAGNSNYQSPGSLEIQFGSVHTPDGRTLPISISLKNLGKESSQPSSGRNTSGMGMGMNRMVSMAPMYAMAPLYMASGSSTSSTMTPMIVMMGTMGAMRLMRSGMGMGSRSGGGRSKGASEAKISKGTQLQLMLNQPIWVGMPSAMRPTAAMQPTAAIQPPAAGQQPPQYASAPFTSAQAGYSSSQPVPGLVQ